MQMGLGLTAFLPDLGCSLLTDLVFISFSLELRFSRSSPLLYFFKCSCSCMLFLVLAGSLAAKLTELKFSLPLSVFPLGLPLECECRGALAGLPFLVDLSALSLFFLGCSWQD